jgi:hypothetical protein
MRKVLFICIALMVTACNPAKRIAKKEAEKQAICNTCAVTKVDSIVYETIYIDTTVYVVEDGEKIYIANPCSELCDEYGNLKEFSQETRRNNVVTTVETKNGALVASCNVDSLEWIIYTKSQTIKHLENTTVPPKIVERSITKFEQFQRYWFWVTVAVVLTILFIKTVKIFR